MNIQLIKNRLQSFAFRGNPKSITMDCVYIHNVIDILEEHQPLNRYALQMDVKKGEKGNLILTFNKPVSFIEIPLETLVEIVKKNS